MQPDIRETPDASWIADTRARFHVEPAVDAQLTGKLERRRQATPRFGDLDDVRQRLLGFLAQHLGTRFRIDNLTWLSGGASKEQFVFDLDRTGDGSRVEKLVLRREPAERQ